MNSTSAHISAGSSDGAAGAVAAADAAASASAPMPAAMHVRAARGAAAAAAAAAAVATAAGTAAAVVSRSARRVEPAHALLTLRASRADRRAFGPVGGARAGANPAPDPHNVTDPAVGAATPTATATPRKPASRWRVRPQPGAGFGRCGSADAHETPRAARMRRRRGGGRRLPPSWASWGSLGREATAVARHRGGWGRRNVGAATLASLLPRRCGDHGSVSPSLPLPVPSAELALVASRLGMLSCWCSCHSWFRSCSSLLED
eukprot:356800-Chlamydomonas_euryale.AAC.5